MWKYEIFLYWNTNEKCMIAEAPDLPGMADGQDYMDAIHNVEVIISEWIETAKSLGRPIPVPRGRLYYT